MVRLPSFLLGGGSAVVAMIEGVAAAASLLNPSPQRWVAFKDPLTGRSVYTG
jgi:hypothetical protein